MQPTAVTEATSQNDTHNHCHSIPLATDSHDITRSSKLHRSRKCYITDNIMDNEGQTRDTCLHVVLIDNTGWTEKCTTKRK